MKTPYTERAEPHDDYTITLEFKNGEQRLLDVTPYLDTPVFAPFVR